MGDHLASEPCAPASPVGTPPGDIWSEVKAERERAHAKHQDTSMESQPVDDLLRLAILMEEVGEVAKEFNEARHDGRPVDQVALRKELIQTAAMAGAWADACYVPPASTKENEDG